MHVVSQAGRSGPLGAQRAGAVYGRGGAGSAAQARPCFLAVEVLWFRSGQVRLVSSVTRVSACLASSAPVRPSPARFGSRPSSKGFLCAAGQAGVLAEELPPQPHNLDLDQPEAVLNLPGVPPHLKLPPSFFKVLRDRKCTYNRIGSAMNLSCC